MAPMDIRQYMEDSRAVKARMANARPGYLSPPLTTEPKPNQNLVIAGWVTLVIGFAFWPLLLVSFVLGVILAAKGTVLQGVLLMVLSIFAPLIVLGVLFA